MKTKHLKYLPPLSLAAFALASTAPTASAAGTISRSSFGSLPDGRRADLYTLSSGRGMTVRITNLGGIVTSIMVPDRNGKMDDVVLGLDTASDYFKSTPFFGALVGRYANRIARSRFVLDGKTYQLAANNGRHSLHGGRVGFDKKLWKARPLRTSRGPALDLTYFSPSGEEGYPGNLNVRVRYTVTPRNELRVQYWGVTDRATVVNLTQHSYFNLKGHGQGDILNHRVTMYASRFLPTDSEAIPTGELRQVRGTPFDFLSRSRPRAIGERVNANEEQIKAGRGYDHNFILDKPRGVLGLATRVFEPQSGRVLSVSTTEPGMQLYVGNFLDNDKGKDGAIYKKRGGFCLEAQKFPDAPNRPSFPSATLRPGQTYRQTTVYRFSTQ